MIGRRRLAGAGLESNQAGGSDLRKVRASPRLPGAFQRRENQSGNIMCSGRVIRAHPDAGAWEPDEASDRCYNCPAPGEPAARSCYPAGVVRLDSSSFCHRKAELTMGKDKYRLLVVREHLHDYHQPLWTESP